MPHWEAPVAPVHQGTTEALFCREGSAVMSLRGCHPLDVSTLWMCPYIHLHDRSMFISQCINHKYLNIVVCISFRLFQLPSDQNP